jgi:GTP cyclohydrolase I
MSLLIEIEPEDEEAQANTPTRFVRAYNEILSGYTTSPETVIGKDFEQVVKDDLVIVKNIPFYSLCKHHMLPFFGDVSIGYLPTDKILGLSKFPRLVKCLSQRLQVQENLGRQICDILHNSPLKPKGVICVINARHLCMEMRGIESKGSTITASIAGAFVDNSELKREFYHLIG